MKNETAGNEESTGDRTRRRPSDASVSTPLRVDAETDALISHSAHFLGITKKEVVARAVRTFVEEYRSELEKGIREAASALDGSRASKIAVFAGVSKEDLERLGGTRS